MALQQDRLPRPRRAQGDRLRALLHLLSLLAGVRGAQPGQLLSDTAIFGGGGAGGGERGGVARTRQGEGRGGDDGGHQQDQEGAGAEDEAVIAAEGDESVGGGGVQMLAGSPGKVKQRLMTSAEIMRQQMGVTEQSDGRLRKTLLRGLVGQEAEDSNCSA